MAVPERDLLTRMFQAAVSAAAPDVCVPRHLPPPPAGRTVVVGAGKAAAAMAQAVQRHWPVDRPLSGLVVTCYGHGVGPLQRIELVEASHPVPDAVGQAAAARMLDLVRGLGVDDLVLCLISGGGSALLALPAPGLDLAAKQAVNRALLRSGARIHEMNCVRKHLSAIKGGRLAAAAAPAQLVTLMISDVPGTASLKVAWEAGEQRPTHRRRYIRVKPIVRPSMLDAVRDQLLTWLEAQPALTAVAALERLRELYPDRFTADHLRTVQRFMKVRRLTMAREVLLGPLLLPTALVPGGYGQWRSDVGRRRHENPR